jgi:hypothetical protein
MQAVAKIVVVTILLGSTTLAAVAGPTRGPRVDSFRCNANITVFYNEDFRGGELATISLEGDGTTDLDLYVFDMNGNLVVRAIGLTDRETVRFFPPANATYRVEVRNLGNDSNQYTINMR